MYDFKLHLNLTTKTITLLQLFIIVYLINLFLNLHELKKIWKKTIVFNIKLFCYYFHSSLLFFFLLLHILLQFSICYLHIFNTHTFCFVCRLNWGEKKLSIKRFWTEFPFLIVMCVLVVVKCLVDWQIKPLNCVIDIEFECLYFDTCIELIIIKLSWI